MLLVTALVQPCCLCGSARQPHSDNFMQAI